MVKIRLLLCFLFVISCREGKLADDDKRNALMVTINAEDNLLAYSYFKDNDYAVKVEDLRTNNTVFVYNIQDNCFTNPRIHNGKLYFPESNHVFVCVSYKTGKPLWKLPTQGRILEFQMVKDDIIIASVDGYGIIAIHADTGKILYVLHLLSNSNCQVDLSPRPVRFDENYFYVAGFNCKTISAYEILSGKKVWSREDYRFSLSSFIITGDFIFSGNMIDNDKEEIILLEAHTSKLLYRQPASFDLFTDPVVYQDKIYYHTNNAELKEFDIRKKTVRTVFTFRTYEDIIGGQMFRLDHFLFFQDMQYQIVKIDLQTFNRKVIDRGKKGLLGVYKINDEIKLIY